MNRLQKKCFIASSGVHLLLALILVIGPAFISTKPKPADDMPILDFVPVKTVDSLMSGGGNPKAQPPPAPPTPQPQPAVTPPVAQKQAEKTPEPDPPKEP